MKSLEDSQVVEVSTTSEKEGLRTGLAFLSVRSCTYSRSPCQFKVRHGQWHRCTPTAPLHLHGALVSVKGPLRTDLWHPAFSPSTKPQKEFFKRLKKISDQELQMRQPKEKGLELISPWTVKPNCFQWVLTFLRIIKGLAVTFHKGPITTQASSTCCPRTMSDVQRHTEEN